MEKTKQDDNVDRSLKLLVKSSLIVFIGLLLSKLFFYFYRIITARTFGPEVYGLLSISIMVAGWFIAISSLGLFDGILRYVSLYHAKKEKDKLSYVFKISLIISGILGVLSSILLFFTSESIAINIFHNTQLIYFLKFFSITIPVTLFSYILLSVIKSYEKIGVYSFILNIFQNFIKLILLILFIFLGLKTNAVIFSYILGVFVMFLSAYIYCKYKISEIWVKSSLNGREKSEIRKQLISYSWPLMFFSLISGILPWIDTILLGYYENVFIVGIYNAAVPIAMLLSLPGEVFAQLFFPLITRHYVNNDKKTIKELSKQVGKWVFMVNLPVLIIMLIFPGTIINFLFGAEYISASNSLRFLSIGFFISSLFIVSDNLIAIIGKSKLNLINIMIASAFNFMFNIFLIPRYGMEGAAIGTMLSFIIFSLLRAIESYYFIKILPLRRKMINILLISLIPTLVIYFTRYFIGINKTGLIISGALFILIYVFLLFVTKCFDKNDLMIIQAIRNKFINKD